MPAVKYLTPDEANETWSCPMTMTASGELATCIGSACAAWRWRGVQANEHGYADAVKAKVAEGMKHKEATAWVMDNREALGIPTEPYEGWCGLGGKPEA